MDAQQEYIDLAVVFFTSYGINVISAILILIVGYMIAGWTHGFVTKLLRKNAKIDITLSAFFASLARYLILIFTVIAVLGEFGVQTASLITILGAASLAVGLALQGTLSNVAAGVMLLIFRPFKIGDFVEAAGHAATVKDLGLFVTELATADNVQIIVPNNQIWGSAIKNYAAYATRRIELVIGIGYDDDMDDAIREIGAVIDADDRCLKTPEASIFVGELGASSVNIVVRVWTESGNFWPLKAALTKNIKHQFDEKNISIPYPQQDIHVVSMAK